MNKRTLLIAAADGHDIPATLVSTHSRNLVILSHGITTGKDENGSYTQFAEEVLSPDCDSIRFYFRGHGDSTLPSKQVTVAGEILDFMAIVKWAREQEYSKMFHVGTSFGASITLLSMAHFPMSDFSAVAFWNPVINYQNTFIKPTGEWTQEFFDQEHITELTQRDGTSIPETDFVIGPQMAMELIQLRPQDTVWPRSIPLLVIHGTEDTCVPYEDAIDYSHKNAGAATLHTLQGVDHGFDDKIEEAFTLTRNWFLQRA